MTRRCPKEEIDFLVEKNVVQILMEVKGRSYVESEVCTIKKLRKKKPDGKMDPKVIFRLKIDFGKQLR